MAELARFLFQRGHFSRDNAAVKPSAFLPRHGQTSVFDIDGLADGEVREMGDAVGLARGKAPLGRGEFRQQDVTAVGLRFELDNTPPRHGNLVGWPENGAETKARQKAVALALAMRTDLVLR